MSLYTLKSTDNKLINYEGDNLIVLSRPRFDYKTKDGDTYHLVAVQDTLEDLAHKYYHDATKWHIIAIANMIINPFNLEVGSQLIIPKIS